MQPLRITTMLWGIAIACLGAVAIALYTQYTYDWRPCPWCILQRIIFVVIAIVCIVTASIKGVAARAVPLAIGLVLSLLGIAAALWQHFVAAKSASCSLTLADKIISALHIDDAIPSVFQVTGSCAEAAVSMLQVPFEFWSLALFAIIAVLTVRLMIRLPHDRDSRPSYLR